MMKNISISRCFNFFFLVAFVCFLTSCANNDGIKEEVQQENVTAEQMYNQMLAAKDFENRKLLASSMTELELAKFWNFHTAKLVETNNYNEVQLDFLNDTQVFTSKLISDLELGIGVEPACVVAAAYFGNTNDAVFSEYQLAHMYTILAFDNEVSSSANAAGERGDRCSCSGNFDCLLVGGECRNEGCDKYNRGCGWMGFCACVGDCLPV